MALKKKMIVHLILLLGLVLVACGQPDNVVTIVSQDDTFFWQLSPQGTNLAYTYRGKGTLINLATKEVKTFKCQLYWWDEQYLNCKGLFVWDNFTHTEIFLTQVNVDKQIDFNVTEVLTNAEKLYKPEWLTDTIYALNIDHQIISGKNYALSGVKNVSDILQNHAYISIPDPYHKYSSGDKVFSPDGQYYYLSDSISITIYTVEKDEELSKFAMEDHSRYMEVAGWEANSSGVYFSIDPLMFNFFNEPMELKKLKVPQP